jgi:hypothetical protein
MAVSYIASATQNEADPTSSATVTIPAGTQTGDDLYLQITGRARFGNETGPTVTDNDTGGNTWTMIAESTDNRRRGTVWHKKATSATASKTITITDAAATPTLAAGVAVYRGGHSTPTTNMTVEEDLSGDSTHAGFTPDHANSMICLGICHQNNDTTTSAQATATSPGALTERFDTGTTGNECATSHASELQSGGPSATGNFTWTIAAGLGWSFTWAIRPAPSGTAIVPNATVDASTWTVTGAATHHAALADESAGTYVQSTANPVASDILKEGLTDFTPGAGDIVIEVDAEQIG